MPRLTKKIRPQQKPCRARGSPLSADDQEVMGDLVGSSRMVWTGKGDTRQNAFPPTGTAQMYVREPNGIVGGAGVANRIEGNVTAE